VTPSAPRRHPILAASGPHDDALLIASHDDDFLDAVGVERRVTP